MLLCWGPMTVITGRTMRVVVAALTAAVAIAALVGAAARAQAPGEGERAETTPAPSRPAATIDKEEAAALATSIGPIVEDIRGQKFLHPVPVQIVDDAAARRHFQTRMEHYWPAPQMRAEEQVYVQLGLLPPKTDLQEEVFDVLKEQAGGYYDPDRDTFFVLGDMPRTAAPIIVAHELTHALDDQHFGIDTLLEAARDSNDRSSALDAVIEGSGTAVMTVYIYRQLKAGSLDPKSLIEFQNSEAGRAERLKSSPLFVQRELIAPYILGLAFLLRGEMMRIRTGGITPSDIDRALTDPPQSTEQILHPEKYWDPARLDRPRRVALPDLSPFLGAGWSRAGEGDLGELTIALMTGLDPGDTTSTDRPLERWTNAAATGWGGDRWNLYRRGPDAVTVLATAWDSVKDAQEFEAAVRIPGGARTKRRGDAVVVLAGDAGDRGGRVLARALDAASDRGAAGR